MNPFLKRVGVALYGSLWQSELARDLRLTDRTIRRWLTHESEIPQQYVLDVLELVVAHQTELADIRRILIEIAPYD